ncbi:DUF6415 family natural product biosynthesis protein [Streptomyces sp. NBC_01304]|uniref:DUF6415 family natural product biosynthesis protein n=1 Tax=Streptomyces sp. NBC_01304 TaxID=2903818 RepID=UPI002E1221B8|nr:DUF6415 family natural product biosynthesis protein [Streptomyces sp. NBC_01304]
MNAARVSMADLPRDVDLALVLSRARPTGPTTDELRRRLREYIGLLADPAENYGRSLADSRQQDIVLDTVRHARAVAADLDQDPAVGLRLLAKSASYLARYAAGQRQT